jgi:hypothetical protein
VRLGGTRGNAFAAQDAVVRVVMDFAVHADGFGIMAPGALHVAAFQKYRCAYSRPVIQRKTLDFSDNARHADLLRQIFFPNTCIEQNNYKEPKRFFFVFYIKNYAIVGEFFLMSGL